MNWRAGSWWIGVAVLWVGHSAQALEFDLPPNEDPARWQLAWLDVLSNPKAGEPFERDRVRIADGPDGWLLSIVLASGETRTAGIVPVASSHRGRVEVLYVAYAMLRADGQTLSWDFTPDEPVDVAVADPAPAKKKNKRKRRKQREPTPVAPVLTAEAMDDTSLAVSPMSEWTADGTATVADSAPIDDRLVTTDTPEAEWRTTHAETTVEITGRSPRETRQRTPYEPNPWMAVGLGFTTSITSQASAGLWVYGGVDITRSLRVGLGFESQLPSPIKQLDSATKLWSLDTGATLRWHWLDQVELGLTFAASSRWVFDADGHQATAWTPRAGLDAVAGVFRTPSATLGVYGRGTLDLLPTHVSVRDDPSSLITLPQWTVQVGISVWGIHLKSRKRNDQG